MPKHRLGLLNNNAVHVVAILHGTHEISLHTIQAVFGRIEGFWCSWTPIYIGPGTLYTAFDDHATYKHYKAFLDTSLIPITHITVDYTSNSEARQATKKKNSGD